MSHPFWLSEAQVARLESNFSKPHGVARVDDRRGVSGICHVMIYWPAMARRACDQVGRPVALHLTAGQVHDAKGLRGLLPLLSDAPALIADRTYEADWLRGLM